MENRTQYNNLTNCSCEFVMNFINESEEKNEEGDDATWILTSAFIIFTMQSGFGLLEAGSVSSKNEANIMVKNAVDIIFGTLGYWMCGYGFSFGQNPKYANGFSGFGDFFTDSENPKDFGNLFSKYFFKLSFATTATTIVSGAMAERTKLRAYMLFSFFNTLTYIFPAHWLWDNRGFLKKLGAIDIAGCGPVHLTGGVSALVATLILKPRAGIFDKNIEPPELASATNLILGTFMLWWGWLGFNCGSTFGVSGGKWKLASRTAVITINGSVGGGLWSIIYCYFLTKDFKHKLDIPNFTSCILGGLVSITGICAICRPWEGLLIGFIGGMITSYGAKLLKCIKVDDPVTCIPVHFFCGMYGLIVVGLFGEKETEENITKYHGIFKGGPASYLGYQLITCLSIIAWSTVVTAIELLICHLTFGLRLTPEQERIGSDYVEHGIKPEEDIGCSGCSGNRKPMNRRRTKVFTSRNRRPTINGHRTTNIGHRKYQQHGRINFGMISYDTTTVHQDEVDEEEEDESSCPDSRRTSSVEDAVKIADTNLTRKNRTNTGDTLLSITEGYISKGIDSLIRKNFPSNSRRYEIDQEEEKKEKLKDKDKTSDLVLSEKNSSASETFRPYDSI